VNKAVLTKPLKMIQHYCITETPKWKRFEKEHRQIIQVKILQLVRPCHAGTPIMTHLLQPQLFKTRKYIHSQPRLSNKY
jgi:hypothetical protein